MDQFKLRRPQMDVKSPVIRLRPAYYQIIAELKAQTGIPMGNIVEQCIDYALEHMEEASDHAT